MVKDTDGERWRYRKIEIVKDVDNGRWRLRSHKTEEDKREGTIVLLLDV